jgi:single-strand DNA-binding protein
MAGIAKVTLVGNLGRDPETRYTPNGTMNVQFSVAVTRRRNDQSGPQETTTWFRVTGWGRLAETLDQLTQNGYLAKGKQVYVSGTIEQREYTDQNNQVRTSLDVRADDVILTGSRADSEGAGAPSGGGYNRGGGGGGGGGRYPSGGDDSQSNQDLDDVPF